MNWYKGSIEEAVNLSKSRNAIFVVYVEGNDDYSVKLRGFINEARIKNKLEGENFVAIRIESGSQHYMQFAKIYQIVPVPSIFFIGSNGIPLEVATGIVASSSELESKIDVLTKSGRQISQPQALSNENAASSSSASAAASASLISNEQTDSTASQPDATEIVCEDGVCYRKPVSSGEPEKPKESTKPADDKQKKETVEPKKVVEEDTKNPKESPVEQTTKMAPNSEKQEKPQETSPSVTSDHASELQSRVERLEKARKLMEEKRKEKEAEEATAERERELERRRAGQSLQNLQSWQKDQELKELKDNIRREKLEDQAARQRILEKIASDRAERAQKFGQPAPATIKPEQSPAAPKQSPVPSDQSRLQFKKPDGESDTHTFKSSEEFQVVRSYVRDILLASTGVRNFSLATTFPRKEFTADDDSKTLLELGLCPTAVLLVITNSHTGSGPAAIVARSGGFVNMFNAVFWGLLSPVFAVFGYIKRLFTGPSDGATGAQKRANEERTADNDTAAKRRNLNQFMQNGNSGGYNEGASTSGLNNKSGKSVPYRRVGSSNIHRLQDNRDSDDESNTWNGNSTQQQ